MKEIKYYMCGYCHTEYASADEAQKCEKSHKQPKEIIDAGYKSMNADLYGYPETILIQMSDGAKVAFKQLRIIEYKR